MRYSAPAFSRSKSQTQLQKLVQRYPKLNPLVKAPVTHVTSFLILHELTAAIPLAGIFWILHSLNINLGNPPTESRAIVIVDTGSVTDKIHQKWNNWVDGGVKKFTGYAVKKGWIAEFSQGKTVEGSTKAGRIILELATSYTIVKILMPVRIGLSLWATPWFARVLIGRVFGRWRR